MNSESKPRGSFDAGKFAVGSGIGAGAVLAGLAAINPEALKAFASIGWPGAATLMFTACVVLVDRGMKLADRHLTSVVVVARDFTEAHRGLRSEVGTISTSLKDLADSNSSALESIKASLGSLHTKVDEVMRGGS